MNILIVDDEVEIIEMIKEILAEVVPLRQLLTCTHGIMAEEYFTNTSNTKIDLLITDILLPGQSGIELTKKFLIGNPAGRVVVMTGGGSTKDDLVKAILLNQAVDYGACVSMAKPFDVDDFKNVVTKLLSP